VTDRRIIIQWTETAKECLRKLPLKVRRGLLNKADQLLECEDPRKVFKPLVGPLQGYYRITYSRYRAIYWVDEEILVNGDVRLRIIVRFVAAGIRKEGDKKDIYRFALRMLKLGILESEEDPDEENPEQEE